MTLFTKMIILLAFIGFKNCKLVNITCIQLQEFVDWHNHVRRLLTSGNIQGQPAANVLYRMMWAYELAKKAEDWAIQNKFEHNPDVTVPSGRFITGENIHKTISVNKRGLDVRKYITLWSDESINYVYKKMEKSDFDPHKKPVGHYTQMVWENSIYLGCAANRVQKGRYRTFLVVCYYGPGGNIIGEYPYTLAPYPEEYVPCHNLTPHCIDDAYGDCNMYSPIGPL